MNAIEIVDYSPEWAARFRELEAVYRAHLGGMIEDVEHVGSTAVPGLAAKPVIDIDLIVERRERIAGVIERLRELGYVHRGNGGITDREAFARMDDAVPFSNERSCWPAHHLYLCPADSMSLRNHLTLRDALRADPALAASYAALKRALAATFPADIDRYVDGKTAFITRVLKDAGFRSGEVDMIRSQNRCS